MLRRDNRTSSAGRAASGSGGPPVEAGGPPEDPTSPVRRGPRGGGADLDGAAAPGVGFPVKRPRGESPLDGAAPHPTRRSVLEASDRAAQRQQLLLQQLVIKPDSQRAVTVTGAAREDGASRELLESDCIPAGLASSPVVYAGQPQLPAATAAPSIGHPLDLTSPVRPTGAAAPVARPSLLFSPSPVSTHTLAGAPTGARPVSLFDLRVTLPPWVPKPPAPAAVPALAPKDGALPPPAARDWTWQACSVLADLPTTEGAPSVDPASAAAEGSGRAVGLGNGGGTRLVPATTLPVTALLEMFPPPRTTAASAGKLRGGVVARQ